MKPQGVYKEGILEPLLYALTGFLPKNSVQLMREIEHPMTFRNEYNCCMEVVRFDAVNIESSLNIIMWCTALNRFCAAVHRNSPYEGRFIVK